MAAMEQRINMIQTASVKLMRDDFERIQMKLQDETNQLQRQITSVEKKNAKDIQSVKENITAGFVTKLAPLI